MNYYRENKYEVIEDEKEIARQDAEKISWSGVSEMEKQIIKAIDNNSCDKEKLKEIKDRLLELKGDEEDSNENAKQLVKRW